MNNSNTFWLGLGNRLITIMLVVFSGMAVGSAWRKPNSETTEPYRTWVMPGTSLASPAGFGASWGQMYVGGGYNSRARFTTTSDASMGIGFGLGNGQKYVGLDVSLAIFDISKFKDGGVNMKLHRALPNGFGVAVGAESILSFGTATTFGSSTSNGVDPRDKSFYGSVSKIFFLKDETQWFSALTLTAGVGNGRFRSEANRNADVSGVNIFGSAAIRVKQPVAFIADWTGQDLNLGLSITPIRTFPLFINPVLADVTKTAGDGARFTLGAGMAFTFI